MSAALVQLTLAMSADRVLDARMGATYDRLCGRLLEKLGTLGEGQTWWVGIAGGPGAGKSTLATAVCERINAAAGSDVSVVVPMDGFHYSRARLRELDPPDAAVFLPRRGAPWTFDAEGLCEALAAAKASGAATLPTYSRVLSDPVPGGAELKECHRIVLAEGNYLLMKHDARWAPLMHLWDETWFVACGSAAEQRRRLVARHLETWNAEKSQRWGEGELGAAARADANDLLNMELIARCREYADVQIESL
jgi:pantothenate kinase